MLQSDFCRLQSQFTIGTELPISIPLPPCPLSPKIRIEFDSNGTSTRPNLWGEGELIFLVVGHCRLERSSRGCCCSEPFHPPHVLINSGDVAVVVLQGADFAERWCRDRGRLRAPRLGIVPNGFLAVGHWTNMSTSSVKHRALCGQLIPLQKCFSKQLSAY